MKRVKLFLVTIVLMAGFSLSAQVAINTDGSNPNPSAMLDVKSTDKGFLPPRMTSAERDAISTPADGLIIFNTTTGCLNFYAGGYWNKVCGNVIEPSVTNDATGKTWMDRNLGASQVATSSTDANAYGDLYQWGRAADGHEKRNSTDYDGDNDGLATTSSPNAGNSWDGKFITTSNSPYDWLDTQDDNLWQGVDGTNNPCPPGFRLPTDTEWDNERKSWNSNNADGAYGSPLKLTMAGYRNYNDGSLGDVGSHGGYWSSTVSDTYARHLRFYSSTAYMNSNYRAVGFSVRCIKD